MSVINPQEPAWPNPEQLTHQMESATPYPLETLPPIMRDAVTGIADCAQAPLELAGQCVLGAMAYLAQTRVDAWSNKSYQMPCSLFSLALGKSGEGKSSAHDLAFKPVTEAERERKKRHKQDVAEIDEGASGLKGNALTEYEKAHPYPADPTTIISSDGSISRILAKFVEGTPSLFWSTDEGGQMLGGHSLKADNRVAVLGSLTQLWDKGTGERLRSKDNADASGTFWKRRLSLHLMAQERAIRDCLTDDILREQGFLPRFLFCAPDSLVGTRQMTLERMTKKPEDYKGIAPFWQRINEIMRVPECVNDDGEIEAPRMELTEAARTDWMEFYNETEHQQGRFGRYADLTPFASRGAQNALRVATVIAFFEGKDRVDDQAMLAAIALVDHSLREWRRYACAARVDPVTQAAIDMSEWLIKAIGEGKSEWLEFTGRDWSRNGYSSLRAAAKRDPALALLVEKNHLLLADDKTYRVNPLLLSGGVATTATTATTESKASADGACRGFINCDSAATACDKTEMIEPKGGNVATCRNGVATGRAPQTCTDKGLQGSVANVASVATPQAPKDKQLWEMTL